MRTFVLAAGLIAVTLSFGNARADELEIPGADHQGPTFQRPAAENPEMTAYITTPSSAQAPATAAAPAASTAQPRR